MSSSSSEDIGTLEFNIFMIPDCPPNAGVLCIIHVFFEFLFSVYAPLLAIFNQFADPFPFFCGLLYYTAAPAGLTNVLSRDACVNIVLFLNLGLDPSSSSSIYVAATLVSSMSYSLVALRLMLFRFAPLEEFLDFLLLFRLYLSR